MSHRRSRLIRLAGSLSELDILVNCAGIIRRDEEFEMPVFEHVVSVNLSGAMRMCVGCKPLLARSPRSIVNIASMLTFSAARAFLLTRPARAASPSSTRSLAVAGRWTEFASTRWRPAGSGRRSPMRCRQIPFGPPQSGADPDGALGRTGRHRGPVGILVLKAAAFITGVVLPVDGGYSVS